MCSFVERVFLSPTAHSDIVAHPRHNAHMHDHRQSTCHSDIVAYPRHNAHMHDHCQSTCRLLYIFFFHHPFFVIGCDPQMYTVGGRLVLTLVNAQAVIPQLTSDSASNTH